MRVIVITGTPGTGKTTIAKRAAQLLKADFFSANDMVKEKHLYTRVAKDGSLVVDMTALKKEIDKLTSSSKKQLVLEGHLLCEIPIRGAGAIVLREHLKTLEGRMKRRGYDDTKIRDNIVAEAIDYCGESARSNYNEVCELMASDDDIVKKITDMAGGDRFYSKSIDLLEELREIILKRPEHAI